MDYLLKCETNAQRLRIINLLKDHYLVTHSTLHNIESDDDFENHPNITIDNYRNENELSLVKYNYQSIYVILTEEEFLNKYLPQRTQWHGSVLKFSMI